MPEYTREQRERILAELYEQAGKVAREESENEKRAFDARKRREQIDLARDEFLRLQDRTIWQTASDEDIHCTDFGNALRFMKHYGRSCLYCPQQSTWYLWNGEGYWKRDSLLFVEHMVREMLQNIYSETKYVSDPDRRAALAKWAIQCEKPDHVMACLKELRKMPSVSCNQDIFDTDKFLFNMENGTYDLQNHMLIQHDRIHHITRRVSYKYDITATCPEFITFLNRIFKSQKDKVGLIEYIQKAVGYSLTGDTSKQVIFLLHGSGANGKSTLIETLRLLLGEYGTAIGANALTTKKNDSVRNDIARLVNIRFCATSENAIGTVLDEELIKSLTGGDQVAARFLFQEEFLFHPQLKLWWAFNHPPGIRDMTHSLWRRLKMIPFEERIPDEEQIPQPILLAKFKDELPGIFNWAVEGLKKYQKTGLQDASAVRSAVQEFKDDQDRLFEFFTFNCDDMRESVGPDGMKRDIVTAVSTLYESYKGIAQYNNEKPLSQRKFSLELMNRGFQKSHTKTGTVFHGIKLKSNLF